MADIVTTEQLQNASLDAQALEKFINGSDSETVLTRLNAKYPTLQKAIKELFENGGLPATPFKTKALMTASALVDGKYAQVTDDSVAANNGLYVKTAGAWVKSSYDPLTQAKNYADSNKLDLVDVEIGYTDGNIIGSYSRRYSNYGTNGVYALVKNSEQDSIVVAVAGGSVLSIFNDKGVYQYPSNANFVFLSSNPYPLTNELKIQHKVLFSGVDANTGIAYQTVKVPDNANFMILNTRFTRADGVRTDFEWTVHEGAFNSSKVVGSPYVHSILGKRLSKEPVSEKYKYPTTVFRQSAKNLYTGFLSRYTMYDYSTVFRPVENTGDVISALIPVTQGKTYTVSGLNPDLLIGAPLFVQGYSGNTNPANQYVETIVNLKPSKTATATVSNPAIKYISVSLSVHSNTENRLEEVKKLNVQIEEGSVATSYEPPITSDVVNDIYRAINNSYSPTVLPTSNTRQLITQFNTLNAVRDSRTTTLKEIKQSPSAIGVSYSMTGQVGVENSANSLYAQINTNVEGVKDVYIYLMNLDDTGARTVGRSSAVSQFNVPSGSLDNPDTVSGVGIDLPNNIYVHPSIAYSATPVAGYKYWMIASTYPPNSRSDALWEDEDIFVSNNGKDWQRIQSLYETTKTYTHPNFRLPPQSLVTKNARKNAFLPSPSVGDVLEISIDATSVRPAIDREVVTLKSPLWKHDPYIMIDNGYVYTYHTFHLGTANYSEHYSAYIVCVRTNDGINWEVVRKDGSTMLLTAENSKKIFTKDDTGRYNYMLCLGLSGSGENPAVIKFGEGDYHLYYGRNFAYFYKGTTPYSFDYSKKYTMQQVGAGNHPGLLLHNDTLYFLTEDKLYSSTDRGVTFTAFPHYPVWLGGVTSGRYKKTFCVGEGGEVTLFTSEDLFAPSATLPANNQVVISNRITQMYRYEYPSFNDFLSHATNKVGDAHVDVELIKVNYTTGTRVSKFIPNVSCTNIGSGGTSAAQKIKVANMDIAKGDTLFAYVTLNATGTSSVLFSGIELS